MQPVAKQKELEPVEEQMRRNLEAFIKESGYTANEVADLSGVANLGRYLRGENAIPATALPALSEVLGHTPSDFFLANPPPGDLENAPPVFFRRRPGIVWTEDDQKDADEFLRRVRSRRTKKNAPRKGS